MPRCGITNSKIPTVKTMDSRDIKLNEIRNVSDHIEFRSQFVCS
jgi:hypothetical protein